MTTLTLSLYLILTPYLTSSAQNLISFFELFSEFGTIENTLSNFNSLKFESEETLVGKMDISNYNLYFYETSTNNSHFPKISNINLKLDFKQFIIIEGEAGSGKETLFGLLTKKTKLSSGSIFIDNKNIDNISQKTYSSIISFTNTCPYFYNISIIENFLLVCANKTKIIKTINSWNLKSEINKLDQKLNTVINQETNQKLTYFLGILKCFLSGAKIICIYGVPGDMNQSEKVLLKNIFEQLKKDCLVVLFSDNLDYSNIANHVYHIANGKIN